MLNQVGDASSHWEPFPKDVPVSVHGPPGADNDVFLIPVRHCIGFGLGAKPLIAPAYVEDELEPSALPRQTTSTHRAINTEQVAAVCSAGSSDSWKPPPNMRPMMDPRWLAPFERPKLFDKISMNRPQLQWSLLSDGELFVKCNRWWEDVQAYDGGHLTNSLEAYDDDPMPPTKIHRQVPNNPLSPDWPQRTTPAKVAVLLGHGPYNTVNTPLQVNHARQVWTPRARIDCAGPELLILFPSQQLPFAPWVPSLPVPGTQRLRDLGAGLIVLGLSALSFLEPCLNSNWLLASHAPRGDAEDDNERTRNPSLVKAAYNWIRCRCDLGSTGLQQAMQLSLV